MTSPWSLLWLHRKVPRELKPRYISCFTWNRHKSYFFGQSQNAQTIQGTNQNLRLGMWRVPRAEKCASRQLAAATSDWLIRWHDVFQPITKLRFTQPNQSPHFQNCLCPTLSNPLHYYYDLSIHKSLYLSVVIVTLCKTMPHDQFKSAFIPYK